MARRRSTIESAEIAVAALRELAEGLHHDRDANGLEVASRMLRTVASASSKLVVATESRRAEVLLSVVH